MLSPTPNPTVTWAENRLPVKKMSLCCMWSCFSSKSNRCFGIVSGKYKNHLSFDPLENKPIFLKPMSEHITALKFWNRTTSRCTVTSLNSGHLVVSNELILISSPTHNFPFNRNKNWILIGMAYVGFPEWQDLQFSRSVFSWNRWISNIRNLKRPRYVLPYESDHISILMTIINPGPVFQSSISIW